MRTLYTVQTKISGRVHPKLIFVMKNTNFDNTKNNVLCLGCEKNSPTSSSSTNSTTHHSLNRSPTRRMAASSSCPSPLPPELRETAGTGINSGTPSSHQQSSRHKPLVVAEGEYRGVVSHQTLQIFALSLGAWLVSCIFG